jgi:hypothetical protein
MVASDFERQSHDEVERNRDQVGRRRQRHNNLVRRRRPRPALHRGEEEPQQSSISTLMERSVSPNDRLLIDTGTAFPLACQALEAGTKQAKQEQHARKKQGKRNRKIATNNLHPIQSSLHDNKDTLQSHDVNNYNSLGIPLPLILSDPH